MIYQHAVLNLKHDKTVREIQDTLNQFGIEGFRLVSVVDQDHSQYTIYYFVKEIEPIIEETIELDDDSSLSEDDDG